MNDQHGANVAVKGLYKAWLLLIILLPMGCSSSDTTEKDTGITTVSTAGQESQTQPPRVLKSSGSQDLNVTVKSFEKKFQDFVADGDPSFKFRVLERGSTTKRYGLSSEIQVVVMVNKGKIVNAALFSDADPSTTLTACGLFFAACEPNLTADQRSEIITKIGIGDPARDMFSLHEDMNSNGQHFVVSADGRSLQFAVLPSS